MSYKYEYGPRHAKNIESDASYGHDRETNAILHGKNLLDMAEPL